MMSLLQGDTFSMSIYIGVLYKNLISIPTYWWPFPPICSFVTWDYIFNSRKCSLILTKLVNTSRTPSFFEQKILSVLMGPFCSHALSLHVCYHELKLNFWSPEVASSFSQTARFFLLLHCKVFSCMTLSRHRVMERQQAPTISKRCIEHCEDARRDDRQWRHSH